MLNITIRIICANMTCGTQLCLLGIGQVSFQLSFIHWSLWPNWRWGLHIRTRNGNRGENTNEWMENMLQVIRMIKIMNRMTNTRSDIKRSRLCSSWRWKKSWYPLLRKMIGCPTLLYKIKQKSILLRHSIRQGLILMFFPPSLFLNLFWLLWNLFLFV